MKIGEIEKLTENEVRMIAEEKTTIKGYEVYFVDLGEYFKYSAVVFKNNHQIKYANDYELHHSGKTKEELKKFYLKSLEKKLFTEEEMKEPLTSYIVYKAKSDFLHNLYVLQTDYISHFHCYKTEEERQKLLKQTEGMYNDPIAFAWVKDESFLKKHIQLYKDLFEQNKKAMQNFDFCKEAFLYEMYNHEYGINWSADYEVLNCFTDVSYKDEGTAEYLERTDFTQTQKDAYYKAKKEYFKKAAY